MLREIKESNKIVNAKCSYMKTEFDLNAILTGNDYTFNTYVFRGTVVDIKQYEVSWTDENGENWGPFNRTIISVEKDKEYNSTALSKNFV